jgi:hypothetical protein
LELTERLNSTRLAQLAANLPGEKSRQALIALADSAEFLDLPAAELPVTPAPDRKEQAVILARVREYVAKTIPKLPNFFATRETMRFEDTPPDPTRSSLETLSHIAGGGVFGEGATPMTDAHPNLGSQPLHIAGSSRVTVLYRDGYELVDAGDKAGERYEAPTPGLSTLGEFGPVLITVMEDVTDDELTWSHWENGGQSHLAVFRYVVPQSASRYTVVFTDETKKIQYKPAYHGEMAVNPADGSILRLSIIAELKQDYLVTRSDILVEYGPVEIAGITYICPLKSVALSLSHSFAHAPVEWSSGDRTHLGPLQTQLNDVLFKQYHVFRAETRIMAGDNEAPDANPPSPPK